MRASGLSPRVRGIQAAPTVERPLPGSIPACTGNPGRGAIRRSRPRVYPRVYGESRRSRRCTWSTDGLSPRVRGIRSRRGGGAISARSIPACTGNPRRWASSSAPARVYPRVYGESGGSQWSQCPTRGLSPRVRGILLRRRRAHVPARSIPACTGNPAIRSASSSRRKVYPRVYGESVHTSDNDSYLTGLSPRVRGIHPGYHEIARFLRSIPACTGNPSARRAARGACRVYPRVYGESDLATFPGMEAAGLSPRVRGILRNRPADRSCAGSIPACTGNPGVVPVVAGFLGVYPRVYGESTHRRYASSCAMGLSPRVRGIRAGRPRRARGAGSIPACTGNPWEGLRTAAYQEVYPRVYGESAKEAALASMVAGLSPRVRGIPLAAYGYDLQERSIPACTGNPGRSCAHADDPRVYPRVYGESSFYDPPYVIIRGLSPRVRGIPRGCRWRLAW